METLTKNPAPRLEASAFNTAMTSDLLKAINDASGRAFALWITFLTVATYLAISIGTTTHLQLLLEGPLKLPLLGVDLSLFAFYGAAPVLFLVLHLYVLMQLYMLSQLLLRFDSELLAAQLSDSDRARTRLQLDNFVLTQLLIGHAADQIFVWFLRLAVWLSFLVAPVLLLFAFQLQFLPYHSTSTTWTHRVVLLLDLTMLWAIWPKISRGPSQLAWLSGRRRVAWRGVMIFGCALLVVFSVGVATIPGELIERKELGFGWPIRYGPRVRAIWWPTWALFEGEPDPTRSRPKSVFSRNLVLIDAQLVEADSDKLAKLTRTLSLRGRDLRYATLDRTDLRKADLTGANLQGASLSDAQLQDARLNNAELQKAWLLATHLQGASLDNAQLQGAVVNFAELQGANLSHARLQGASLNWTQLQGAKFDSAGLQAASLRNADLAGASFDAADLQGAVLFGAKLQAASLGGKLQGADLRDVTTWLTYLPRDDVDLVDVRGFVVQPMQQWQISSLNDQMKEATASSGHAHSLVMRALTAFTLHTMADEEALAAPWRELAKREWSIDTDDPKLARLLTTLGCDAANAPHVARGLVRRLSDDSERPYAAIVAQALRNQSCVGARDLTDFETGSLDSVARGEYSKTTRSSVTPTN